MTSSCDSSILEFAVSLDLLMLLEDNAQIRKEEKKEELQKITVSLIKFPSFFNHLSGALKIWLEQEEKTYCQRHLWNQFHLYAYTYTGFIGQ